MAATQETAPAVAPPRLSVSELSSLPPTRLPRFDVFCGADAQDAAQLQSPTQAQLDVEVAWPRDSDPRSILTSTYARWVAQVAHAEEACFRLGERGVVLLDSDAAETQAPSGSGSSIALRAMDMAEDVRDEDVPTDFGLTLQLGQGGEAASDATTRIHLTATPLGDQKQSKSSSGSSGGNVGDHYGVLSGVRLRLRAPHATQQVAVDALLAAFVQLLRQQSASTSPPSTSSPQSYAQPSSLNFPLNDAPTASDAALHAAFEARAAQIPNAPALRFLSAWSSGDSAPQQILTLSYAQLDRRANRLAHRLLRGVRAAGLPLSSPWPGSVPLLLGPSPALYISQLACLKAGLAFSPLPVDAPQERLAAIVRDQGPPPVAVYSSSVCAGATSCPAPDQLPLAAEVQWVDVADLEGEDDEAEDAGDSARPDVPHDGDRLAYILYTSGSTGLPKGVQITHRSAAVSIRGHLAIADGAVGADISATNTPPSTALIPGKTRWFQFAAPTFDPSVMEIFCALSSGAALCSAPRAMTLNDLNRTVHEVGAHIMMATPSLARLLKRDRVPKLRCLWTMGEALGREVIQEFAREQERSNSDGNDVDQAVSIDGLWNAYGPTEAAINCTLLPMLPSYRGTILGPALPTCSLFVVDPATLQPLPCGLSGELIIGGPQVSQRGYLNRPLEAAKSFVYAEHLGGRVYRTGDAARLVWNTEGQPWIEILGRIGAGAGQVKINGQRLELAEVESALRAPELGIALVKALKTSQGALAAFVQLAPEAGATEGDREATAVLEEQLRHRATSTLPPFARPRFYAFSHRSFLSLNGKLDSRDLTAFVEEAIQGADTNDEQDFDAPMDEPTRVFVEMLRSITGSGAELGPSTPLRATSLDSLAAMRLLDVLRTSASQQPGCEALANTALKDLVGEEAGKRTVAQAVRHIVGDGDSGVARLKKDAEVRERFAAFDIAHRPRCEAALSLPPGTEIAQVLPVTATQAGILASFVRSRSYVHHFSYALDASVDLERFCAAAERVFSSAESMRSVYMPVDDELSPFAQVVLGSYTHAVLRHATVEVTGELEHAELVQEHLTRGEAEFSSETPGFKHQLVSSCGKADGQARVTYTVSVFHGNFDGGSLDLLLADVAAAYRDRTSTLPSARPGPRHASHLYIEATTGEEAAATRAYWDRELVDFEAEPFPAVHGLQRGSKQTEGTGVCEHLTTGLSIENLASAARRLLSRGGGSSTSASPSPLALAQLAWALVLQAYSETSREDVVFGSVVSNRLDSLSRACAAPTFTTIPVRVRAPLEGTTVSQGLAQLSAKAAEALSHAQPALGSITVEGGVLPYDTLIALQLFAGAQDDRGSDAPPALWDQQVSPPMPNDFAIMLEIWPGERQPTDPLRLRATYKRSVLDEKSCGMLLRQVAAVLEAICELAPEEASKGSLASLFGNVYRRSSVEQQEGEDTTQLCSSVGRAVIPTEDYSSLLLHRQFETYARSSPDAPALLFSPGTDDSDNGAGVHPPVPLTYAQLDTLASRLAHRLLAANGGKALLDTPVPLYTTKGIELFIAVLAILKAGGAWCPIEPSMPRARKAALIRRTGAHLVVVASRACLHEHSAGMDESQGELRAVLNEAGIRPDKAVDASAGWQLSDGQVVPGEEDPSVTAAELDQVSASLDPAHLAYCIWTSGSTGEPKGVLIEHRAAARAMLALQREIWTPTDLAVPTPRTINFSAFTFDVFVQDLFYTWGLGGAVVAAPQSSLVDPASFIALARLTGATHTHLTPAYSAVLGARSQCPSLRVVTEIGEKLGEDVALAWQGQGDDADMAAKGGSYAWNTYGPAENAVVSTYRSFQAGRTHNAANVGWPLDGVQVLVMRADSGAHGGLTPTLRGGTGELALGGGQVARGYLGDEARTAKSYPTLEAHGRIYLTGDIVRMLADGSLDFVGRRDDLIKVGGIRVELSEISHALAQAHPALRHIETLFLPLTPGGEGSKLIVAFLLVGDVPLAQEVTAAARIEAKKMLPAHMRPARYVVVDRIPRSNSAKTDSRALTATFHQREAEARAQRGGGGAGGEDTGSDDEGEGEGEGEIGGEKGDTTALDPAAPKAQLAQAVITVIQGGSSTGSDDAAWQRLARRPRTSLRALGLDSIRTIRLSTKIRQMGTDTFARKVAAFELMRCETFGELCAALGIETGGSAKVNGIGSQVDGSAAEAAEAESTSAMRKLLEAFSAEWLPKVRASTSLGVGGQTQTQPVAALPATLLQASLLVETAKSAGGGAYWSTTIFDVAPSQRDIVDADTLKQAWLATAQEHETLRTTFVPTAQGYVQCVLPREGVEGWMDWEDLGVLADGNAESDSGSDPDSEMQKAIKARAARVARARASRGNPLYWAVSVFRREASSQLSFAVHMHHALYDGPAFDLIVACVSARVSGAPQPIEAQSLVEILACLDESTIAWGAGARKAISSSAARGADPQRWEKVLSGRAGRCTPWSLPDLTGERPRPAEYRPKMHYATRDLAVDAAALTRASREVGFPSSAGVLQAAFGALVADYLDQGSVLVGSTLSERGQHPNLETAVFPLVVTVPFVVDAGRQTREEREQEDEQTARAVTARGMLRDLASQWKATAVPAQRNVSAREIRRNLQWQPDQPLYPAIFVVHDNDDDEEEGEGEKTTDTAFRSRGSLDLAVEHPFVLNVYVDRNGVPARLVFSALDTAVSAAQAEILADQVNAQVALLVNAINAGAGAGADVPMSRLLDTAAATSSTSPSSVPAPLLSIQPPAIIDEWTATSAQRHPAHWVRQYATSHPDRMAAEQLVEGFLDEDEAEAGKLPPTRSWTYAQLDAYSDNVADMLRNKIGATASPSPVVALCMNRSLEAFACVLAIMKAQCIYLPIAEELPAQRKLQLVSDARAAAIFVSSGYGDVFQDAGGHAIDAEMIDVDALPPMELAPPRSSPRPLGDAHGTGYLLFTSGSTGKPKGVSVSGANLSSYVDGYAAVFARYSPRCKRLTDEGKGRYLNAASRAFDPHLAHMFTAWRNGYATITGERSLLIEDLARTVKQLRLTHMGIIPSLVEHSGLTPAFAPSLACLGVGGEKISPFVLDEWAAHSAGNPANAGDVEAPLVLNVYGPTEVTIGCTLSLVAPWSTPRNIGYPLGNSTSCILVPGTDSLAWRGQAGELCMAGDLVAHGGYTSSGNGEAAPKGGFATVDGGLIGQTPGVQVPIYRTGDVAAMLADGSLSFLGRTDDQIKIRGQRFEPGEVNNVVKELVAGVRGQSPNHQNALTVYVKHPRIPTPRLFSIVACGGELDAEGGLKWVQDQRELQEEIAKQCKAKLPAFMVPTVVLAEEIPKLPSGKFDGKKTKLALQAAPLDVVMPEAKATATATATLRAGATAAGLTARQKQILAAACDVAGADYKEVLQTATPSTSIFELGIDSLSAVGLSVRLRDKPTEMQVSVSDILQRDTLGALADGQVGHGEVEDEEDEEDTTETSYDPVLFDREVRAALDGDREDIEWVRPAMPLQESLVTLSSLARQRRSSEEGASSSATPIPYVHTLTIAPRADLRLSRQDVVARWRALIRAEPMLRTCLREESATGKIVQVVLRVESPAVERELILEEQPRDAPADIVDDVARVPPLRVWVDDGARAHVWIHHSIYDGHTLGLLLADVYGQSAVVSGGAGSITPRPANNAHDTAMLLQAARAQGSRAARFWRRYFSECRPAPRSLAAAARATDTASDRLGRLTADWSGRLAAELRAAASTRYGTTLSTLVQACFAVVVSRRLGTHDVVLGNVLSGRSLASGSGSSEDGAAQDSRMPCVTTVPIRHRLRNTDDGEGAAVSLDAAIQASKRSAAAVRAWEHTSLRRIQGVLGRGGLFEILYSYEIEAAVQGGQSDRSYSLLEGEGEGEGGAESDAARPNIDYPLVLNVSEGPRGSDALKATLAYSERGIGAAAAEGMAAQLRALLDLVVSGRSASPSLDELRVPLEGGSEAEAAATASSSSAREDRPLTEREGAALDVLLATVKGVDRAAVGPYASFYAVGLDSMVAMRFARELRKSGVKGIDAAKVMESGNLAALCGTDDKDHDDATETNDAPQQQAQTNGVHVNGAGVNGHADDSAAAATDGASASAALAQQVSAFWQPLTPRDTLEAAYECTPLQAGMLTLSHGAPSSAYHQVHRVRLLRGAQDVPLLKRAWERLIKQTDVLRTTFHLDTEQARWVALVHSDVQPVWNEGVQGATLPNGHGDDFGTRPPVAVDVLEQPHSQKKGGETIVLFHIHHALYDGASLPVLFAQLRAAVGAESAQSLPRMVPFHRVAKQMTARRQQDEAAWADSLTGYEYAPLRGRTDDVLPKRWHARTSLSVPGGGEVDAPPPPSSSLAARCRSLGVTLHAVCVLAYARVLARSVLARRDVAFGHVLDGRGRALDLGGEGEGDEAQVIGPLFNTVARRVPLDDLIETNAEQVARVQRLIDEGATRQAASLRGVTAEWRAKNKATSARLFDCLFVYQKQGPSKAAGDDDDEGKIWESVGESSDDDEDGEAANDAEYEVNVAFTERRDGTLAISANASNLALAGKFELEHMVEALGQVVSEVLLQPSAVALGKDLAALPLNHSAASAAAGAGAGAAADAATPGRPLDEDEAKFCDALAKVIREIGVPDWRRPGTNVVEVGIDSITAIRLAGECRKARGVLAHVTVLVILRAQTVAAIVEAARKASQLKYKAGSGAAAVHTPVSASASTSISDSGAEFAARRQDVAHAAAVLAPGKHIQETDIEDVFEVLPGQAHHLDYWFAWGRRFYEGPWVMRAESQSQSQSQSHASLDAARLAAAWHALRTRHAILRSTFVGFGGGATPRQVVLKATAPSLHSTGFDVVEVESDTDAALEEATRRVVAHGNARPSTLFTVPNSLVVVRARTRSALVLRFQHAMYDALSIPLLLADLRALYAGASASGDSPRLSPTVDYAAIARKIKARYSARADEEKAWWAAHLADADRTLLRPGGNADSDGDAPSSLGAQGMAREPAAVVGLRDLEERVAQRTPPGINLSHVVILAVARVLRARSARANPDADSGRATTLGFYSAARSTVADMVDDVSASGAPIPLLNVLPLAVPVPVATGAGAGEGAELTATLQRIKASLVDRAEWEQSSLRDVVRWCGAGRPLFNCFLNLMWHVGGSSGGEQRREAHVHRGEEADAGQVPADADTHADPAVKWEHWRGLPESSAYFLSPRVAPAVAVAVAHAEGGGAGGGAGEGAGPELVPTTALGSPRTYDTAYLHANNCFVEVRRNAREDCLAVSVKADVQMFGGGGRAEERMRELCRDVAREVLRVARAL